MLSFGSNILSSNEEGQIVSMALDQLKKGARMIVVDPRRTELASRADLWLQLKPGTETALALGLLNVVIEESLYDKEFVEKYTYGFEDLAREMKKYSPEVVSEITWVPADLIRQAARMYATVKPAALQWGNAIEHSVHAFDSARSLVCLMAITGHLEVPGGTINRHLPRHYPKIDDSGISLFSEGGTGGNTLHGQGILWYVLQSDDYLDRQPGHL
jgi:anaerobic selenocysteine-containing dehydrogenase